MRIHALALQRISLSTSIRIKSILSFVSSNTTHHRYRCLATTTSTNTNADTPTSEPMETQRLYQYLNLQTFSTQEFQLVFDKIIQNPDDKRDQCQEQDHFSQEELSRFLLKRIQEIEKQIDTASLSTTNSTLYAHASISQEEKTKYANLEAHRIFNCFQNQDTNTNTRPTITKQQFVDTLTQTATTVDMKRMWPMTLSILLVGTSVGITTPAMPFVVEKIALTPTQYGTVVSAFALAKMACNIPSAVLVERHGRKPYLTFSLAVIALGVGGIGAASSFEQLYLCRLLTGAGVAALTTASQLMVTDVSTPRNRATTMSPIASAFAAGTALGPAFGGTLVDQMGLENTFYMVGASYLGVALLNRTILKETKPQPMTFPWMQIQTILHDKQQQQTLLQAVKEALGQWVPLFRKSQVRSVMAINGVYWFALAGSQMTLLPLILTNPSSGLNMTASGVGQVYMLMSLVQVMSNPIMARYLVDRIGKVPAIAGGSGVIASSMLVLPTLTEQFPLFISTLAFWALGSSMLSTAPLAYISDKVKEEERAQAIAMLRTSGDVGFLFGASVVGGLADYAGSLEVAMQSSGGLLSAATVWFVVRQSMFHVQKRNNKD